MSKIGIVTLPLHFNFGGILQAYALQETIRNLGGTSYIITPQKRTIKQWIKSLLYSWSGVSKFVRSNISYLAVEEPFMSDNLSRKGVSTLVVGSDQVWRPSMGDVSRYFLKTDKKCVKKIAYAASFGVDNWEFSDEETKLARELVRDFSDVSVRERSGLRLCSEHLSITNSIQVLDPTMLVGVERYKQLMSSSPYKTDNPHCFIYLLDYDSTANQDIVASRLPQNAETLRAKVERNVLKKYLNTSDTVEKWLASIYYSDLMITDSFHGCVFSILFHTDFYVMGNKVGGNTRIQSLLSMFGLEDRYISDETPKGNMPIDWGKVNSILQKNKERSLNFLKKSLAL